MNLLEQGAKYVSGYFNAGGRLILLREDGSEHPQPVILIRATLVDNADGTWNIIPTEEL